ncbi:MAG: VTT domain-containing protein [Vicinamibacterales bacterium]
MTTTALSILVGTFVSEDAAALWAGWLVRTGGMSTTEALVACGLGIYLGDLGLWLAGRLLSRRERVRRWCVRRTPRVLGHALALAVDEPSTLVASRFLPGTRLPLYLAAGAVGTRPGAFALWTAVAVALWTPLIVLGTSHLLVGGVALVALLRAGRTAGGQRVWRRVLARADRWLRPEFWPSWLVYAPLAPWLLWLAARHGGVGTLGAANPGLEDGGFVGESKFAILGALPTRWTVPSALVAPGDPFARVRAFDEAVREGAWVYPLILKPDVGQKGVGVRRITSRDEAVAYLAREAGPVVVQPWHPGPFEAGIFYYRRPDEARGRIFSITDKRFPELVGDGESSVEQLLWEHPRYRLQVPLFLKRHDGARVLADGERLPLVTSGNHCQGAMFLDGAELITPAVSARIDEIARSVPGFFIGRFDVRYSSLARFRRGEDLAIVELNGVTSESTNIYDPGYGAWRAWRTLGRQWQLVFEIGAANRARGARAPNLRRLLRLTLAYWRSAPAMPIAS